MKNRSWIRHAVSDSKSPVSARQVSRAAVAGESLNALLELGARNLLEAGQADRAGVWLNPGEPGHVWEGVVVESGASVVPEDWWQFPVLAWVPRGIIEGSEPVAWDATSTDGRLLPGPLEGLRTVTWIPLRIHSTLIGIAMAATFTARATRDLETMENIAEGMAFAVFEHRSKQAEAELRSVLESVEAGVLLLDLSGRIRFTNTRFAQLFGLDVCVVSRLREFGELVRLVSNRFRESEAFAARWRSSRDQVGEAAHDELEMVWPVRKVFERFSRPVLYDEGRPLGWLELYRDITGQRQVQSKMLQTEKMAALGQLVSGIAHELNNPLTAIMGYTQLLLGHGLQPSQLAEVKKIYHEAERARRIVKNLLFFAREAKPERSRVDLNEIVERTLTLRGYELKVENIMVECELAQDLPQTMADPYQLQQVILNLVVNAEHAVLQGRGQGHIWVRTYRLPGNRLALEVADDGPGVPHEIASRIFDPFFTTKPAGVGTGLGLSIVYGIVNHHGGEVLLESPQGGGAKFIVELPIVDAPAEQVSPEKPKPEGVSSEIPPGRVLVVEDEPTVAQLIADVLREEGHQVDAVVDSQEGLTRISRTRYDLVICDLRMPRLNGPAFYEALVRAGSPTQHHIIFVTGDTLGPRTLEFLESNDLPYLAKPFLVEELKLAVNRLLERSIQKSRAAAVGQSSGKPSGEPAAGMNRA